MSYTIKEIIDIAVGIEETGFEFYTECRKKFTDAHVADVFEFLAREELVHKELFQTLYGEETPQGIFTDEYFAYLKAIGGSRIFNGHIKNAVQLLAGMDTPIDAIKHAFVVEKDSILFYTEMKSLYPAEKNTLSLLDRIIGEERKHVAVLFDLAEKIRLL
jgi:rubrerythrin